MTLLVKTRGALGLLAAAIMLSGCPDIAQAKLDANGKFLGAWESNEYDGYRMDCPIALDLRQETTAFFPAVPGPVLWTQVCGLVPQFSGCVFLGMAGLSSDEWMVGEASSVTPRPLIV